MIKNRTIQLFIVFLVIFKPFDGSSSQVVAVAKSSSRAPAIVCSRSVFTTLSSWAGQCKKCPLNRKGASATCDTGFASPVLTTKQLQWEEFFYVLDVWFKMMQSGSLNKDSLWQLSNTGVTKPSADPFFDVTKIRFFMPFAQKLIVPSGSEIYLRGDLHGDIFSLLAQLEQMKHNGVLDDNFRILADNVWILFLGDYVDRGQYGCEVLYTMMRLALANPDRVFFVRGNHEDIAISGLYGFRDEVKHKFNDANGVRHKIISRMNDFLPVVLYLGCISDTFDVTNYMQCCHGGIEIGYDPKIFLDDHSTEYQLLGLLNRKTFVNQFDAKYNQATGLLSWTFSLFSKQQIVNWWHSVLGILEDDVNLRHPNDAYSLGFMWYDFDIHDTHQVEYKKSRGLFYGQIATKQVLELQSSDYSKICGIFRAHQHGEPVMMESLKNSKGVFKLWRPVESALAPAERPCNDGLVWTFNVGPDSFYGQDFSFNFDAYAKFKINADIDQWKLVVFNTQVVT